MTNLFDISCEEFPGLYSMRWGIETYYSKLKSVICLENFSGRTQNAIRQDFFASMVIMIMVAVFQKEADSEIAKKLKNKENKHAYKAKTSDLVVALRDRYVFNTLQQNSKKAIKNIKEIVSIIAYSKSAIRPNRSFPRRKNSKVSFNNNLKSHL